MELYGKGIQCLNYQAETATINNILRDWENDSELATAVVAFNLSEWVSELKTANTEFIRNNLPVLMNTVTPVRKPLKPKEKKPMLCITHWKTG